MAEIISVECIDSFDPKIVRVFIRGPNGQMYAIDFNESEYAILSMLPVFPPNPCKK